MTLNFQGHFLYRKEKGMSKCWIAKRLPFSKEDLNARIPEQPMTLAFHPAKLLLVSFSG